MNADGTVTIWAITSTVSANGDQGADPNKLVSITDTLANTTAAGAATEQFTVVKSAAAGEVLRGVALAPATTSPMQNVPSILSIANYGATAIAPGSLVAANGQNLAAGYPGPIIGLLPSFFDGTSVSFMDASGATSLAPLFYVSPNEVDFEVPANVAAGTAKVVITSNGVSQTAANIQIATVAPGLFTLNNSGLATAYAVRISGNAQVIEPVYTLNNGVVTPAPIYMGAGTDQVILVLYGTGLQAAAAGTFGNVQVSATVGGVNAQVFVRRSQPHFARPRSNQRPAPGSAGRQRKRKRPAHGRRHRREPGPDHNPVTLTPEKRRSFH